MNGEMVSDLMVNSKTLALLLDPEKANLDALPITEDCHPDLFLVGGSTGGDTTDFVRHLQSKIASLNLSVPVVLFPGDASQFTPEADAVLFLSLLSGRNPEYLVDQQVRSAQAIHDAQIEVLPTAYILIDGGIETSTMRVSQTKPLDPADIPTIVHTSIAAELMGKRFIYLEAGSGAKVPVSPQIIRAVKAEVSIPVIVGGGIRTPEMMRTAYDAGADVVVIGNHFESHPEDLALFTCKKNLSASATSGLSVNDRERSISASGLSAKRSADEHFMRLALQEAYKAQEAQEIPIGCIVVSQGRIIGRGHNLTETLSDVTAHAEIQAITAAAQTVGGKYLPDATLYVTVEPCAMCAGAIGWAQINRIVYGAPDPKRGYATYAPRVFHPKASVTAGVLEDECRTLMQCFFQKKR